METATDWTVISKRELIRQTQWQEELVEKEDKSKTEVQLIMSRKVL